MNKFSKNISILFIGIAMLFSCSAEKDSGTEPLKVRDLTVSIIPSDLIGQWQLSRMKSDTLIDLNKDGILNDNILAETSCFNEMGVTFNEDFTFSTINARLDFNGGANNDDFVCVKNRMDFGTWDIDGDELILNINIDGVIYTNRKKLYLTQNTFSFDVSKMESNQYVNDPGNISASEIRILELEYSRI
jgi:hypothetical protein